MLVQSRFWQWCDLACCVRWVGDGGLFGGVVVEDGEGVGGRREGVGARCLYCTGNERKSLQRRDRAQTGVLYAYAAFYFLLGDLLRLLLFLLRVVGP